MLSDRGAGLPASPNPGCLHLPMCVPVCLCACLSNRLPACLPLCPSVRSPVCSSVCIYFLDARLSPFPAYRPHPIVSHSLSTFRMKQVQEALRLFLSPPGGLPWKQVSDEVMADMASSIDELSHIPVA
ncbi:unnamed protein product [Sphacelaria rigidula]